MDAKLEDKGVLDKLLAKSGLTFEEAVARGVKASGLYETEEAAMGRGGCFADREDLAKFGASCAVLSSLRDTEYTGTPRTTGTP